MVATAETYDTNIWRGCDWVAVRHCWDERRQEEIDARWQNLPVNGLADWFRERGGVLCYASTARYDFKPRIIGRKGTSQDLKVNQLSNFCGEIGRAHV